MLHDLRLSTYSFNNNIDNGYFLKLLAELDRCTFKYAGLVAASSNRYNQVGSGNTALLYQLQIPNTCGTENKTINAIPKRVT